MIFFFSIFFYVPVEIPPTNFEAQFMLSFHKSLFPWTLMPFSSVFPQFIAHLLFSHSVFLHVICDNEYLSFESGEGNGNPVQYSGLENPIGAW